MFFSNILTALRNAAVVIWVCHMTRIMWHKLLNGGYLLSFSPVQVIQFKLSGASYPFSPIFINIS